MTTPAAALKKLKAGIRAECARQGIDDASRKLMMMRLAGVETSTRLDLKGANRVLDHLRQTGAFQRTVGFPARSAAVNPTKAKPSLNEQSSETEWRFVFSAPASHQDLLKKIYKLAETVGSFQSPPVPVMSKAWVEGSVKQSVGLNKPESREKTAKPLQLCSERELWIVVQILASWANKHGKSPNSEDRGQKTEDRGLRTVQSGKASPSWGLRRRVAPEDDCPQSSDT